MSNTYGTFEVINIEAEADKSMEVHGNCTLPIISCSNQNDSIIAVGDSEHKNFKPFEIEKNQYRVIEIGKSRSGTRKLNSLWNYFGLAEKENSSSNNNRKDKKNNRKNLPSSSSSNQDRILCLLCYNNDIIHVYMKTTASGNLWRHLNKIHGIPIPKNGKIAKTPINIRKTKLIQNLLNKTKQIVHENEIKNATSSTMYHQQNEMTTTINNEDDINICDDDEYIIPISISAKVNDDDDKLNLSSSTTDSNISSITYLSSQDIGSILIEEIAKRPDLYTLSHDSSKKILRDRLWKEIYESTGKIMSIEQLQKIWRNIRDRYKKIRNSEKNGLTNTGQKYKYYNKLKFLDVNIDDLQDNNIKEKEEQLCESYSLHHKKNKSFLISQIDNDQDEQHLSKKLKINYHENETIIEDDIDNNYRQDEEYLENSQQNIDFINNNDNDNENRVIMINSNDNYDDIKHKIDTNVNVEQMISSSMLPSTLKICNCDCNRQDEFDIFGKFIAQKLRKYSKSISSEIEIKILQLFNNTTNN